MMMTDKDKKQIIIDFLRDASLVDSFSSKEDNFLPFLRNYFQSKTHNASWRIVYENNELHYALLTYNTLKQAPLFIVHMDRVKRFGDRVPREVSLSNTPENLDGIKCQLDNLISIAVLYALHKESPLNILFTTKEEWCVSAEQTKEVLTLYPQLIPISIDIDVYEDSEPIDKITLRSHDRVGTYNVNIMTALRKTADRLNILFTQDSLGYTMSDAGFLAEHTNRDITAGHIGIPIYNYHSYNEIAAWSAILDVYKLVEEIKSKSSVLYF